MLNFFGQGLARLSRPGAGPRHQIHPGWPESSPRVFLPAGSALGRVPVRLRPLLHTDGPDWCQMRLLDESFLRPVEPTTPVGWEAAHTRQAWGSHFRFLRSGALDGSLVPLAIEVDGAFAGQLTLGNIQHGALKECWIGYWVFSQFQGSGVATAAVGLGVDHAFARVGLHRITATYLPANPASGAVLRHCGFREEGYFRRNLHIDGRWQDHHFLALNREDYPTSAVARVRAAGRIE